MEQKIILIDFGHFQHTAIFAKATAIRRQEDMALTNPQLAEQMWVLPSTYTSMMMILNVLSKVGVNCDVDDKIIICCDGRHSWRKNLEIQYKFMRQTVREQCTEVNWLNEYEYQNQLLHTIDDNTPFFVIHGQEGLEADDWIAEACRVFKDQEVVIIGRDSDYHQLLNLDNVKIYNPHGSAKKCPYKILSLNREKEKQLAYKSLIHKIKKEATDGLTSEVLTEKENQIRRQIVSLLELPLDIVDRMRPTLEEIGRSTKEHLNLEAFSPGIQKLFPKIWDEKYKITYHDCYQRLVNKQAREDKKKAKLKEDKKKAKIKEKLCKSK
jgi:hypothetical protein